MADKKPRPITTDDFMRAASAMADNITMMMSSGESVAGREMKTFGDLRAYYNRTPKSDMREAVMMAAQTAVRIDHPDLANVDAVPVDKHKMQNFLKNLTPALVDCLQNGGHGAIVLNDKNAPEPVQFSCTVPNTPPAPGRKPGFTL